MRGLHGKHRAGGIEQKAVSCAVRQEFHGGIRLPLVRLEDHGQLAEKRARVRLGFQGSAIG